MRFLILATAVFACATALPIDHMAYHAPVAVNPAALIPARPTISSGDISGAAIEAQVEVADHLQTAVDAERQLTDKESELHGQAIDNAEETAWRAVDNVKTIEARWDGAAARDAPIIAKNIVRNSVIPLGYNAPAVSTPVVSKPAVSATVASYTAAPVTYTPEPAKYASSPVAYASSPVAYASAPIPYASAPVSYAPAPAAYAPAPAAYASAPAAYASDPGYRHVYSSPIEYTQHLAYDHIW